MTTMPAAESVVNESSDGKSVSCELPGYTVITTDFYNLLS